MDNIDLLKDGIIRQAAFDYVEALKALRRNATKCSIRARKTIKDCKKFFASEWFTMLAPGVDGESLRKKLVKKASAEFRKEQETEDIYKGDIKWKKKI